MTKTTQDRLFGDTNFPKDNSFSFHKARSLKKVILHLALSFIFSESTANQDQYFDQAKNSFTPNKQSSESLDYQTRLERQLSEPIISCYGTGKVFGKQQTFVTSDLPFILANESWDTPAVLVEVRFATDDSPYFALQVAYQVGQNLIKEGPIHGSSLTHQFQVIEFDEDETIQIDEVHITGSLPAREHTSHSKSNKKFVGDSEIQDVESTIQNKLLDEQEAAERVSFISLMTNRDKKTSRSRPANSSKSFTPLKQSKGLVELTKEQTTKIVKQGNKQEDLDGSENTQPLVAGFTILGNKLGKHTMYDHLSQFTEDLCVAKSEPRLAGFITSSETKESDQMSSIQFIYHGSNMQQCGCLQNVILHQKPLQSEQYIQGYNGHQKEQFRAFIPENQFTAAAKSQDNVQQKEPQQHQSETVNAGQEIVSKQSNQNDQSHRPYFLGLCDSILESRASFLTIVTLAPIMMILCVLLTFFAYKKRLAVKEHQNNQQRLSDVQRSDADQEIQHRHQIRIPANIIANSIPMSPAGDEERAEEPPAQSSGTSANISQSPQCPTLATRFPLQLGQNQSKVRIHVLNPERIEGEQSRESLEDKSPKNMNGRIIKDDDNKHSQQTEEGSTLDQHHSIVRAQEGDPV